MHEVSMMDAPQWLIDLCLNSKTAKEFKPKSILPPVRVDLSDAEQRALNYLDRAPQASVGNRNGTTFAVAAKLRDFGIPEPLALSMIQDHYNGVPDKCEPALDDEEVERVVRSAYKYANSQQGHDSPEGVFAKFINPDAQDPLTPQSKAGHSIEPIVFDERNPLCALQSLPRREWILGRFLLAGKVTVLIAPPGAGKSIFSIMACISTITGSELVGMTPYIQGPALIINNEDDLDEINRRVHAILREYDLAPFNLLDQLHIHSGVETPFIIAKRNLDGGVRPLDYEQIKAYVIKHQIKVVVCDPFIETHQVSENSNEEIAQVGRLYRKLAVEANCAVLLIHHTRKPTQGKADGYAGNADSGRGASALMGVARIASTLYTMTDKDAKKYSIPSSERHTYIRLDDAKANLSLMSGVARWFRKDTLKLPNGDDVGVLRLQALAESVVDDDAELLSTIIRVMGANNLSDALVKQISSLISAGELTGKFQTAAAITKQVKALLEEWPDGRPFEDKRLVMYEQGKNLKLRVVVVAAGQPVEPDDLVGLLA